MGKRGAELVAQGELPDPDRTGLFTTGIVSITADEINTRARRRQRDWRRRRRAVGTAISRSRYCGQSASEHTIVGSAPVLQSHCATTFGGR
jgi:hypothetical protein